MNFAWALEQLKAGKKVREKGFSEGVYIYLDRLNAVTIHYNDSEEEGKTLFLEDFEATDWELYEEKPWTLSDKITINASYWHNDVKEFIRLIKEDMRDVDFSTYMKADIAKIIDKRAGEALV